MFDKILIANRGEIACRIMRTARAMGIGTVAVYSDADRDALHVTMADEAVHIGPAPAAQSYLVMDKIIAACRQTGADAVHPGYGFLSERAEFAQALAAAGIAFIGPNPKAIAAMGDKIAAKKAAIAAGVSTVPGHAGAVASAAEAKRAADGIGYPVMIKASAGGGGKGMRVAHSAAEIAEGFERARSEAKSSFGDDRILIEKFITNPRHIEIQLLGDQHGNVVYLHERECSIQRRNQKVLEEAPSPLLDAKTRKAMGEQAVALAKAVNYDSAGTVEFVAGQDRSFYFLEMNTRLQVEHPVTEMITGLDLVEEMIRVAAGEKLRFSQAEVQLNGWAVETRVYAEDPSRGFVPSIGRLTTYRPPEEGEALDGTIVRVDSGVTEGGAISIHYDPMIAKLVTHGETRDEAIAAQARALDAFVLEGIRHNIPFLSAVMAHPRWQAGDLSTGFIAEEWPDGFSTSLAARGDEALARRLAAVALHVTEMRAERQEGMTGRLVVPPLTAPVTGPPVVQLDGVTVALDDPPVALSDWQPGERLWTGTVDDEPVTVQIAIVSGGIRLTHGGVETVARVLSRRVAELALLMPEKRELAGGKALRCPMPGVVRAIAVAAGQAVRAGDTLAVVEAMKMENALRAERDGTIKAVHVAVGDSLAVDAVILEFA
jgi:propionyl-CoA carboxylase alpha chain